MQEDCFNEMLFARGRGNIHQKEETGFLFGKWTSLEFEFNMKTIIRRKNIHTKSKYDINIKIKTILKNNSTIRSTIMTSFLNPEVCITGNELISKNRRSVNLK